MCACFGCFCEGFCWCLFVCFFRCLGVCFWCEVFVGSCYYSGIFYGILWGRAGVVVRVSSFGCGIGFYYLILVVVLFWLFCIKFNILGFNKVLF